MPHFCYRCQHGIALSADGRIGRRDLCEKCSADLHACKNCKFYSTSAYNECSEPSADRVVEKERSNFCDYFVFRVSNAPGEATVDPKDAARKRLDDLFK